MKRSHLLLILVALSSSVVPHAAADPASPSDRQSLRRTPVVDVFQSNRDAVVNISSKEIVTVRDPFADLFQDFFESPFGRGPRGLSPRQYTRTSVGSGFVLHRDGYVVTNAHVVSQTADRKVIFADGREYEAQIVASDPTRDLAVLKIDAEQPLPTLRLGRSNDLMVGETVVAIGNPLGYQHTVTSGVVSALGRDLEINRDVALKGLIQTDASINPGNSGGPLLNVLGELIGVNTAIRGDAQNIGFAIPVDQLRDVLPELLDVERRYRVVTGMTVAGLDGPQVAAVVVDSPADRAGVVAGDMVEQIDGRTIEQSVDYCIAMIGHKAGDTVAMTLDRDGKAVQVKLTLEARPAPDGAKLAREKFGLIVEPMPEELANELRLRAGGGLLVAGVEPGSPAEAVGFRRRDVLVALGRHYLSGVEELGQLLEQVQSGQTLSVTVLRVERNAMFSSTVQIRAR